MTTSVGSQIHNMSFRVMSHKHVVHLRNGSGIYKLPLLQVTSANRLLCAAGVTETTPPDRHRNSSGTGNIRPRVGGCVSGSIR